MKLLIIDESKTEQWYLCHLLSDRTVEIDSVTDPAQAATYLEKYDYDRVLIDRFSYAGLAEDLLKELAPLAKHSHFAVMDSQTDQMTTDKLFAAGFHYVLNKPVKQTAFSAMLFGEENDNTKQKQDPEIMHFEPFSHETGEEPAADDPQQSLEESLHTIPGLSVEGGLKYCGSMDVLTETIKIFYEGISQKYHEIKNFWENDDLENYTIKVHALKSSSRLIGAAGLSAEAEALELAGKEKNLDFIQKNHDSLLAHLLYYQKSLSQLFENQNMKTGDDTPAVSEWSDSKAAASDTSHANANESFDALLMESLFETITDHIAANDTAAIRDSFTEMEEYVLPPAYQKTVQQLKQCFENHDLSGMIRIIKENGSTPSGS